MVSSRSLKPIIWALNFGFFIRACPVSWDPINCCMVLKYGQSYRNPFFRSSSYRSGCICAGMYFLLQLLHSFYLVSLCLFLEHSTMDFYMSLLLLTGFLFSMAVQLLGFLSMEEIVHFWNSFLILDLKIRKYERRTWCYL